MNKKCLRYINNYINSLWHTQAHIIYSPAKQTDYEVNVARYALKVCDIFWKI